LKDQAIVPVAFCPIARAGSPCWGQTPPIAAENPILKKIAERYNKSPYQVILRWGLDRGCSILPKSSNPERQKENLDLFDFKLTEEEVKEIEKLD